MDEPLLDGASSPGIGGGVAPRDRDLEKGQGTSKPKSSRTTKVVFISHASEDKDDVARPLAFFLRAAGVRVWLDEDVLTIGDSILQIIDKGILKSRYVVVILSRRYFEKKWTNNELSAAIAMETIDRKVVLPVLHGINSAEVAKFSAILADRLSLSTESGFQELADRICILIVSRKRGRNLPTRSEPDGLGAIRRSVFLAKSAEELDRAAKDVEIYIRNNPDSTDAAVFKDQIGRAIGITRREEQPAFSLERKRPAIAVAVVATFVALSYALNERPSQIAASPQLSRVEPATAQTSASSAPRIAAGPARPKDWQEREQRAAMFADAWLQELYARRYAQVVEGLIDPANAPSRDYIKRYLDAAKKNGMAPPIHRSGLLVDAVPRGDNLTEYSIQYLATPGTGRACWETVTVLFDDAMRGFRISNYSYYCPDISTATPPPKGGTSP